MQINRKSILLGILAVLTAFGATFAAFYGGYIAGLKETNNISITGVADITPGSEVKADFGVFWQAWSILKSEYLHSKDVTEVDMLHAAIKGLAENLGDPYTMFFTVDDAEKFNEDVNGEFGGIGAELESKSGQITVVTPMKGLPADKAGVKPKDIILKVDGIDMIDKDLSEAVKAVRGPVGSHVKLLTYRSGDIGPKEVDIVREKVSLPPITWNMEKNNLAYVKINNFGDRVPSAFYQALLEMVVKNPQGMIIDLRGNPGGYVEMATELGGWFMDIGDVVVREKYASGEEKEYKAYGTGALKNMPVVILVDGGTASASEILAGALRDHNGSKLIGEKTFGKGTVQIMEQLKDGSMLKITVANWLTPKGTLIDKQGLSPDIEVKYTEEDALAGRDPQLDKAIEVLGLEINK
ncbi:MAG: S41 family peptidase [Candidatus Colwellbacteria bacterium]|nr:S41 family peptidase [Candidatus Colwellbacteria bacterium]